MCLPASYTCRSDRRARPNRLPDPPNPLTKCASQGPRFLANITASGHGGCYGDVWPLASRTRGGRSVCRERYASTPRDLSRQVLRLYRTSHVPRCLSRRAAARQAGTGTRPCGRGGDRWSAGDSQEWLSYRWCGLGVSGGGRGGAANLAGVVARARGLAVGVERDEAPVRLQVHAVAGGEAVSAALHVAQVAYARAREPLQ